jgi:predicted nucleotidyltransferase
MKSENYKILSDLKVLLYQKYHDNLKDVVLFGSQTNNMAAEGSDFDILVVLKNPIDWKTERDISDICYEIDLKYGIITDTHVLSEDDLLKLKGKQPIFVNALSNGVHA